MEPGQSGRLLSSMPPVVATIMRYLSAKELNTCARVDRLWNSIAQGMKKKRKSFSWFFFAEEKGNCEILFTDHLRTLQTEPTLILMFCSNSMISRRHHFFNRPSLKRKSTETEARVNAAYASFKNPVVGRLLGYLPPRSELGFCTSCGIIGTSADKSTTKEIELDPALGVLFFPSIPGVEIYRFQMSGVECNEDFDIEAHTGIPEEKPLKCLLVFLYDRLHSHGGVCSTAVIQHFLHKQDRQLALGGAYVNHMYFPKDKPRRRNQCYALAFAGDNVEAASLIIGPSIESTERIEKELSAFFKTGLLQYNCLGFMFACVARGTSLFDQDHVESGIFRKLFPSVPLFGVFGNGEIGINYVPNAKITSEYAKKKTWSHSYCTVFVLLAIKN